MGINSQPQFCKVHVLSFAPLRKHAGEKLSMKPKLRIEKLYFIYAFLIKPVPSDQGRDSPLQRGLCWRKLLLYKAVHCLK